MIELTLKRMIETPDSTAGALLHGSKFLCFTIEDGRRDIKIKGQTRIPEGRYKCKKATDTRFNAKYKAVYSHNWVMRVLDVPNFEGIEIHIGNYASDTHGCVLPNTELGYDSDTNQFFGSYSGRAYSQFYHYIDGLNDDEIYLTIK